MLHVPSKEIDLEARHRREERGPKLAADRHDGGDEVSGAKMPPNTLEHLVGALQQQRHVVPAEQSWNSRLAVQISWNSRLAAICAV